MSDQKAKKHKPCPLFDKSNWSSKTEKKPSKKPKKNAPRSNKEGGAFESKAADVDFIVRFGKYKGKDLSEMTRDRDYMRWLESQSWWPQRKEFQWLLNLPPQVDNNHEEEDLAQTPAHNALQVKWLDASYTDRMACTLGRVFHYHTQIDRIKLFAGIIVDEKLSSDDAFQSGETEISGLYILALRLPSTHIKSESLKEAKKHIDDYFKAAFERQIIDKIRWEYSSYRSRCIIDCSLRDVCDLVKQNLYLENINIERSLAYYIDTFYTYNEFKDLNMSEIEHRKEEIINTIDTKKANLIKALERTVPVKMKLTWKHEMANVVFENSYWDVTASLTSTRVMVVKVPSIGESFKNPVDVQHTNLAFELKPTIDEDFPEVKRQLDQRMQQEQQALTFIEKRYQRMYPYSNLRERDAELDKLLFRGKEYKSILLVGEWKSQTLPFGTGVKAYFGYQYHVMLDLDNKDSVRGIHIGEGIQVHLEKDGFLVIQLRNGKRKRINLSEDEQGPELGSVT